MKCVLVDPSLNTYLRFQYHVQLRSEYDRRIQEVKKLEAHIIQAREKTAEKEEDARIKMIEEVGDKYYELGLPPGTKLSCD